jgi:phosphoribosylaminoimidazole carboxylase (NCAIR synthetase)
VRVREHQQPRRITAIRSHIRTCKAYKSKFKFFKKPNTDPNISEKQLAPEKQKLGLSNDKLKFKYFTSHFKILQKNFRSLEHRMDAEAFFIRMKRPSLNKQEDLSFFELF